MKHISMKVPPLNQLYQQKQGYEAYKKKLQRIMSHRKNQLLDLRHSASQKIVTHFERRYNARSLELARQNSKIVQKIQSVKSSLSRKESFSKPNESRISSIYRNKSKIIEQERQNYRIKNKVQSMSSSLSSKLMDRDYHRSIQIKNRLMHFKTEENQKVMLKANRYLGSNHQNASFSYNDRTTKKQSLPLLSSSDNYDKEIIDKKMGRVTNNAASHYKKEEIAKNRVINANKMFRLARERRMQAVTML